jgi:hypothetical protein
MIKNCIVKYETCYHALDCFKTYLKSMIRPLGIGGLGKH